jgi:glycerol-3-phosphate acyltransferase PlsY
MIATFTTLLLTWLLGAIPFGVALTTLSGGEVDIREGGSGNIGATNVGRLYGRRLAAAVLLLDALKGFLPVLYARWLWFDGGIPWFAMVGLAAVVGHCWPIYLDFRGGKGVATSLGALMAISPIPAGIAAVIWGLVALGTRRGSVASLVAIIALVPLMYFLALPTLPMAILLGGLVLTRHIPNIERLVRGEEAPITPVHWGRSAAPADPEEVLRSNPSGTGEAAPAWRAAPKSEG